MYIFPRVRRVAPGPKPAKPKIRVETPRHSLEKLLGRLPGRREHESLVTAEAADQPVVGS